MAARLDFTEFAARLDTLCTVVVRLVCESPGLDISRPPFHAVETRLQALGAGASGFRSFFFAFAKDLLAMKDGEEMQHHAGFLPQCKANGHEHTPDTVGSDHVEYLAASALALYFLGLPFSHPWERVRNWVESNGGGLPNGAFMAGGTPAEPAEPLLVNSHMPLILHKSFTNSADVKSCVPDAAHVLGHCYELLQMRLYANEELPFMYFVPARLVEAKLRKDHPADFIAGWHEALDWLSAYVFQKSFADQLKKQFVVLTDVDELPPVFLNGSAGVFTSARPAEGTRARRAEPLPATFIREARMKLYRARLKAIPAETNLLEVGRAETARRLEVSQQLFGVPHAGPAANAPVHAA
jgi:hypothetical protein